MTERLFPSISDHLEWNLITRRSLVGTQQVGRRGKVTYLYGNLSFAVNSYVCLVGCDNPKASANWRLGCYCNMLLLMSPSYTTNYVSAVQVERKVVRLGVLNLLVFPRLIKPWLLEFDIPKWHEYFNLEVWRYDGADIDSYQRFAELETKIDAL